MNNSMSAPAVRSGSRCLDYVSSQSAIHERIVWRARGTSVFAPFTSVLRPGADIDEHDRRFKMQCTSQSEMCPPLRSRLDLEQSGAFSRGPQIA
jgi:hypothetical protein